MSYLCGRDGSRGQSARRDTLCEEQFLRVRSMPLRLQEEASDYRRIGKEATGSNWIDSQAQWGGALRFAMSNYQLFDSNIKKIGAAVTASHFNFTQYNNYKLFMLSGVVDVKNISLEGVRLDNMHIVIVLKSENLNWPPTREEPELGASLRLQMVAMVEMRWSMGDFIGKYGEVGGRKAPQICEARWWSRSW